MSHSCVISPLSCLKFPSPPKKTLCQLSVPHRLPPLRPIRGFCNEKIALKGLLFGSVEQVNLVQTSFEACLPPSVMAGPLPSCSFVADFHFGDVTPCSGSPRQHSSGFLDLWLGCFHHIYKLLGEYFFAYFWPASPQPCHQQGSYLTNS